MTTYSNPVLPGMFPDPSVCRVGDTFYVVTSSFEYFPGLPLHASTDLVHWEPIGHAINRPDQVDLAAVPDSGGLYAATLRHHDGVFYLACTVVGDPRSPGDGSFLITATDPTGPWTDPVWIEDARGIDPTLFFHDDRVWWAGCRQVEMGAYEGQTEIWLRELDLAAGTLIGEEYLLWNGALHGAVWSEGPHLFERDGWFYLLTAEGGTERNHAVSVARSRVVTGPYRGHPGNPILTHRHLGSSFAVQNVGHADLVEASDGSWWSVALGVRPVEGFYPLGRETFLASVAWEDGWPVVNPGLGRLGFSGVTPFADSDTNSSASSTNLLLHEDFRGATALGEAWLSPRGPADWAAFAPDGLIVTATADDLTTSGRPAFIGRRLQHHEAIASIRTQLPQAGATVGLVLRQSSGWHIRLELARAGDSGDFRATAISRGNHVDTVVGSIDLPHLPRSGTVDLTADLHGSDVALRVSTTAGNEQTVAVTDARVLGTEQAGGFVGTILGPFVTGSGSVTISSFTYTAGQSPQRNVGSLSTP